MLLARKWAIRHSGLLEKTYLAMERCLLWAAPLLRAIGYDRLEKPVARFEGAVKGVLFDCKMCGDCMLSVTGMSCWTNCPKGNRNGPCGGVRQDQMCEVDPNMRCVWVDSWQGSQRMAAGQLPITPNPPSDYSQTDSSSWLKVIRQSSEMCRAHPVETTEPAAVKPSGGKLEQLLRAKTFVVTAEFSPPDSANSDDVRSRLAPFDNCVDAINVTDSSGANCHMSSLAVSVLLAQANCEPIMQMTCRDRNRIAIQADLLGASALGIKNMLCLTGDSVRNGDQPGAKPVGDLDAVTLLNTARTMRDEGRFLSGRRLSSNPPFFLGAADNPFAPPFELRPARLARKILAGAQFVQTQYCFDVALFERYMERVRDAGLHQSCFILVGVGPIGSARTARWLNEKVPGVHIPDDIVTRLESAQNPKAEGKRICVEIIQRVRQIEGVAGIHLMTPKQDHLIPDLIAEGGLLDRHAPSSIVAAGLPDAKNGGAITLP